MAARERSIGTVIELVVELLVVEPKPFKPAEAEVVFLPFVFLALRLLLDDDPGAWLNVEREPGLNASTGLVKRMITTADVNFILEIRIYFLLSKFKYFAFRV
jgi:hypothetical protein